MEADTFANIIHITLDEMQLFMAYFISNVFSYINNINHSEYNNCFIIGSYQDNDMHIIL